MYARIYQLAEDARALELVADCKLWDIIPPSQPSRTLVLACPGVVVQYASYLRKERAETLPPGLYQPDLYPGG